MEATIETPWRSMRMKQQRNPKRGWLPWPPLSAGRLIRRYKRFLADVALDDGRTVTAHCPNSGSMAACCEPGRPVYLSAHDDPKRKLKFTWELIHMPTALVGVNTLLPNRLSAEAIDAGLVPELTGYGPPRREVKVDAHTRLDLMLPGGKRPDCYIEVKNCTLVEDGVALFPDARTVRGQKHLETLARIKAGGGRAVMLFIVQRGDATVLAPADRIDPAYGRCLRQVAEAGVQILVYDAAIDMAGIALGRALPCQLEGLDGVVPPPGPVSGD
jgi:sugar fermentation stimulation protein A